MDLKNPSTANDIAALAESLADQVEAATPGERKRALACSIVALLLCPTGTRVRAKSEDMAIVIDESMNPISVPKPFNGLMRGSVRGDFLLDLGLAIETSERVFDGWGWDVIKWPRGQGADLPTDGPAGERGSSSFVYDAEVTPTSEHAATVAGRSLIGQHGTAAGAMLAAILRAYAYKVKHDAGSLEPVEIGGQIGEVNFDITAEERAFINDIVERAEELEIAPPAARVERMMDIAATHKNGCPLDLESFLHASTDFAFTHDFLGIVENLDRTTGKLRNQFLPRYAQAEPEPTPAIGVDNGAAEAPMPAPLADYFASGKPGAPILSAPRREPGLSDQLMQEFGDEPKNED